MIPEVHRVWLILGSNHGNRFSFLKSAAEMTKDRIGRILSSSFIYESAPWGFLSPDRFLNQVLLVETRLSPEDVLDRIRQIEQLLGRERSGNRYDSRTIDVDILFYENRIIETDMLKIPHPRIGERRFALVPLMDVSPELIHPVLKKNIATLMVECADPGEVMKIENVDKSFLVIPDEL